MNTKKVILLYTSYCIIIISNTKYINELKKVILFGCLVVTGFNFLRHYKIWANS